MLITLRRTDGLPSITLDLPGGTTFGAIKVILEVGRLVCLCAARGGGGGCPRRCVL